jgi:hypothetical protein
MLAIAGCQSMKMLTGLTSSRASPLPPFYCGEHRFCTRHRSFVGVSLLAIALGQSMKMLTGLTSSRAGSLLQFLLG